MIAKARCWQHRAFLHFETLKRGSLHFCMRTPFFMQIGATFYNRHKNFAILVYAYGKKIATISPGVSLVVRIEM